MPGFPESDDIVKAFIEHSEGGYRTKVVRKPYSEVYALYGLDVNAMPIPDAVVDVEIPWLMEIE